MRILRGWCRRGGVATAAGASPLRLLPHPLPPYTPPPPPRSARRNQLAKIPDDVIDDASLLRSTSIVCPRCGTADGVMIQAKPLATDDKIKLILVCANRDCAHKWQL